jgi:hypothetical protein
MQHWPLQDLLFSVDLDLAEQLFNVARPEAASEADRQALCADALRSTLTWLNKIQVERLQKNIKVGVDNVFKGKRLSLLL